jgi:hypothetical protein
MQTAPVRASPATPRRRQWAPRSLQLAAGAAGAALAVGAALVQPFAASHLFPGSATPLPHAAAPPAPPLPAPVAAPPAGSQAVSPPPPQAAAAGAPAQPMPAVAAPTPQLASPPETVPPKQDQARPMPVAAPEIRPAGPAVLGAPPPPREPLPLQTDLINPTAPADLPGANAASPAAPAGGAPPAGKPAAGDRHG